ncbi:hypothetical protein ACO0LG_16345 [Undibacterium sp. Ji42W]|uniref:hypothetical protein n=1 Tax=Undibacterium sp. Ji42W TaxID=3413039 RepID=UPI003BF3D9C4
MPSFNINRRRRTLLLGSTLLLLVTTPTTASSTYQKRQIDGWTLMFDQGWQAADAASRSAFASVLTDQLNKLRKLPAHAQSSLRSVSIYVSSGTYRAFGAQHHPSAQWLREHAYPVEFAGNIEICHWKEFTTMVRSQPYALLHEMAHAYHFQHPELDAFILGAYEKAKAAGLYRQVTRDHGPELQEAYAMSNHREYFAELSEAYFGENDFYPYQNADLKQYDAPGYAMLERVWRI